MAKQTLLRKLGIRHFDELIHDQPREWLVRRFSRGADEYPVNVALLMRNLIWQMRERVIKKDKPPYRELIRTFWYSYVKPTLSRAGALAQETDQYVQMVDTMVAMVKDHKILEYKDIGFRDNQENQRRVGVNAHVILFSEKVGHQPFIFEIADQYNISALALGGQPSLLNIEYFVDELKAQKVDIRRSFYLFSIVDYDTSGWIIRDAFRDSLRHYGVKNTRVIDLVHPDMLTPDEIKVSRYQIHEKEVMRAKNKAWLREIHKRGYKNQRYLEKQTIKDKKIQLSLFGLEAESVSTKRLTGELERVMVPLLGKSEDLLKVYEFKQLNEALEELILHKVRQEA